MKIQLKKMEKPSITREPWKASRTPLARSACCFNKPNPANPSPRIRKNSRYFRWRGSGKTTKSNNRMAQPNKASITAGTRTK
jgi:hypothetical protein